MSCSNTITALKYLATKTTAVENVSEVTGATIDEIICYISDNFVAGGSPQFWQVDFDCGTDWENITDKPLRQQVYNGITAVEPKIPRAAGTTFSYWKFNDSQYDFSQPVTSNITLTAIWD